MNPQGQNIKVEFKFQAVDRFKSYVTLAFYSMSNLCSYIVGLTVYLNTTKTPTLRKDTQSRAKTRKDAHRHAKTCKDTQIFACLCPSLCVFVNFQRFFFAAFACLCVSLRVSARLCVSLPVFACLCVSLRSLGVFAVFR